MTCTVNSPLGRRICELAITLKPTRNMERYTAAVTAQMRTDAKARIIRRGGR